MNVIIWVDEGQEDIGRRIASAAGIHVTTVDGIEAFRTALPRADALITTAQLRQPEAALALRDFAHRLQWIQLLLSGDDVLRTHGVPLGIRVSTVGGAYASAVAEHAMALMTALSRCLPDALENQGHRVWQPNMSRRMVALEGSTLAIAGFGNIGQEIARRARGFGMRILGLRRNTAAHSLADEIHSIEAIAHVIPQADIIVAALPLTTQTHGLIGAAEFALCKPRALFINVGRGATVQLPALHDALTKNFISGAALDVTDPEPLPGSSPLWSCPNLIITPHVGGRGHGPSWSRVIDIVCQNITNFNSGKPLLYEISAVPQSQL